MKKRLVIAVVLLMGILFAGALPSRAAEALTEDDAELCLIDFQKVPRLSIDDLKSRLADPSLVIVDVRAAGDWNASSIKIKGAFREVYADAENWAAKYDKDKTVVLYCA